MQKNTTIDNSVFINAMIGSLLLIVSAVYTISNLPGIAMFQVSDTAIASVLGMSAAAFLFQAMKRDKNREKRIA